MLLGFYLSDANLLIIVRRARYWADVTVGNTRQLLALQVKKFKDTLINHQTKA